MDSESSTMSTNEKPYAVVQLLVNNEAMIMGNVALPQDLWEHMMDRGMLGDLYPTKILANAFIANLKKTDNEIFYETVLKYFRTGQHPK